MQELTEREQKLIEIIKKMITAHTVNGIFVNKLVELLKWKNETLDSIKFNIDWQNETLHILEEEFGLKYNKINDDGSPLEE